MNQTPGTGGYKPCWVLLRNGRAVAASWRCCGGGSNYDKADAHYFYNPGGSEKIEDGNVIAFIVLPLSKNQIEVVL